MKKVVHYREVLGHLRVGRHATVRPVDHPDTENVSNKTWATTSEIVRVDEVTGIFETLNTVYEPTHETQKAAS